VQGLAFLVTFWAMPKSDWPRAATERAGGKDHSSFDEPPHPSPLQRGERGEGTKPTA